jgi:hypothetical protein
MSEISFHTKIRLLKTNILYNENITLQRNGYIYDGFIPSYF